MIKIYFTDFFQIEKEVLEKYGCFNISLINDLPLFIDPFLLFGSKNQEYQKLHSDILKYLAFLKEKSEEGNLNTGDISAWYLFPEVKQNWFGYSKFGNGGSGLGPKFASSMSSSMKLIYEDLGSEVVTQTSHLEKATLFEIGVGKDNISDFTTNLIKEFLLNYTEKFALENLNENQVKKVKVNKVYFDYALERWMPKEYTLPFIFDDYVILTPRDLLTKDDNWINGNDLRGDFYQVCSGISNQQLRAEINNFYRKKLPAPTEKKKITNKDRAKAIQATIKQYPEIINWYIKLKEENKEGAKNISKKNVEEIESIFINRIIELVENLVNETKFYDIPPDFSYKASLDRVNFLKQVIENNDGYRLFYINGVPIKREDDLQIIYRLTWFASNYDVNRETNNGRGPVDYAISKGAKDKTLVEFKLASNSKLQQNLENQVEVYEKANNTTSSIKVILYFDSTEYAKITRILNDLKLNDKENIVLIDAGRKISASNVK
ncbi:hypothetical protein [Epilithonimonas hungarica]|uniref:Uncharacterized protein n=1 Tax=Epilithonimonas hungarica TaxID=454006 RepID=A0A1G7LPR7_9FLAO|nr:hypothetical protein [Epilithonimonas hungarica]SDF51485.1 hypothetical protein SAMN05421825_1564 [Epilithonimonas hungarica]